MASLNEVRLIGNLGQDPDRRDANGTDVCTINIATDAWRGRGEDRQKYTEWHRVVLWGQHARYAGDYLHKGDTVFVGGHLRTRKWTDGNGEDQYTTEVVADDFQGLRMRSARQEQSPSESSPQGEGAEPSSPKSGRRERTPSH